MLALPALARPALGASGPTLDPLPRTVQVARPFRDTGDGRVVAWLRVRLTVRPDGAATLALEATAVDRHVQPALGGLGVVGENLEAAAQMRRLLSARSAQRVVTRSAAGRRWTGQLVVGARRRLTQRDATPPFGERRRATPQPVALRYRLQRPAATAGRYLSEVVVAGDVRLRVIWRVERDPGGRWRGGIADVRQPDLIPARAGR